MLSVTVDTPNQSKHFDTIPTDGKDAGKVRMNRSMTGGEGGFDDSVPGDVIRTEPPGDRIT